MLRSLSKSWIPTPLGANFGHHPHVFETFDMALGDGAWLMEGGIDYLRAGGGELPEGLLGGEEEVEALRRRMLIGPPSEIAERLAAIRAVDPFDELVIWPRLPGVPLELAEHCLHTFAEQVAPLLDGSP